MIELKGKHIAVIGAARSGLAAALLLERQGAEVFVSDASSIGRMARTRLDETGISWEQNGHSDRALEVDLAVVSPGVPDSSLPIQYYTAHDIPFYSELELASWFNRSPIIAVTGSNGKTTVTSWMEDLWKRDNRPCLAAGNIGKAFSECVEETAPDRTAILEVSSFQLDHICHFHPQISVMLNITPDHLDRYGGSFDAYAASKWRITENQQPEDTLIYNADCPFVVNGAQRVESRDNAPNLLPFSARKELENGAYIRENTIFMNLNGSEEVMMSTDEIGLPGTHNLHNGLATALAARVSEIKRESIRESLQQFTGVEHRLELVRILDGVRYVNDSKATNINAVWFALDSYQMPIVLILGGRDKGNDYRALEDQIREKVHTVIAIGEAKPAIREQLNGLVPNLMEADNMLDAVKLSRKQAKRGEVVLMSPACASFDMFDDYEERGRIYKELVNQL